MTTVAGHGALVRARVRVHGTVQGVGFRPFVFRLASALGLSGAVFNDADGVVVEVEGDAGAVQDLIARLRTDAPPLARVEHIDAEALDPIGVGGGFRILASPREGVPSAPVSPDSATCADCLHELFDERDRRHRYPFVNCTNCGPRFTIVRGIPYDRPFTTMAGFRMCAECRAEYDDPADRRFHAQPNACPECGPRAWLADGAGAPVELRGAVDSVQAAAGALLAGAIVAVKGIGGFHLACVAADERAVAMLRARKHREDKPFALMAPSLDAARELVKLEPDDEALLISAARPIVLAPRRMDARVAGEVAPLSRDLGVMLPYSPLHHLLLADVGEPLVMTSGNVSDEPIAFADEDARTRLAPIADLFLLHDRPIQTRTDDSVVRTIALGDRRAVQTLRRSRGHVPDSLALPVAPSRPVLTCGAELKNTFCVAKGDRAWVGHHIGDLKNYETLRSFTDGVEHFKTLFAVAPEVVAHDLHPEYLSTKFAHEIDGVELVGVQHHHAHLAACLAEHGETGRAVGAIYDGTGYGTDGTVWGGELLVGDLVGFERAGLLHPVRMPGGEAAIRQPWRMACAWLAVAFDGAQPRPATLAGSVEESAWRQVCELSRTGVASPLTTSVGRLFDAVAALCGIRAAVNYEGQAAVELEAACAPGEHGEYPLELVEEGPLVLDARPTIRAIAADLASGAGADVVAARFHATIAAATASACVVAAARHDVDTAVLSGGVFQNRRLLERTAQLAGDAGLRVLTPERLPPNDGGISYGQAAVAAARMAVRG